MDRSKKSDEQLILGSDAAFSIGIKREHYERIGRNV
jgi:hypothetical protein